MAKNAAAVKLGKDSWKGMSKPERSARTKKAWATRRAKLAAAAADKKVA